MSFDLKEIISSMNIFAILVAGALVLMAISSLTIFVERWWAYFRSRRRSLAFGPVAAQLLDANDHAGLLDAAAAAPKSYLSSMIEAGISTYTTALANPSGELAPAELVRRELERKGDAQAAQLRRGLPWLASVGSTAPFVGLLGTVIGIIGAFKGIAAEGSGGLGAVSAGIAEALVVTALGLMVAIPATLIFNFLSTRADSIMLALDQARGQLVDHLEARQPAQAAVATETHNTAKRAHAA
jgi:biopolymer transport protein ExbB